ncbi:hypothetical protein BJX65DRAFT_300179 [Aspergillus insuetus]
MPALSTTTPHAGVKEWFTSACENPTLRSAFLFGTYSHMRMQSVLASGGDFRSSDVALIRVCEADAISKINQAIQDPAQALSDEVVLSVMCLAKNPPGKSSTREGKCSSFRAPLRSLQWLDVYAPMSCNPVHQSGLAQIVHLKGGLENIKLPGVAAIISFTSIIDATKSLSRPHFPFISLQPGETKALHDIVHGYREIAHGDDILWTAVVWQMREVFQGLRVFGRIIQQYAYDGTLRVNEHTLCDYRNLLQWHLRRVIVRIYPIYEACRLALMTSGAGVTFPLPPEDAPMDRLVERLKIEVEAYKGIIPSKTPATLRFNYWCLFSGGMASQAGEQRSWFTAELKACSILHGVQKWTEVKTMLESILWIECACEEAGKQFWRYAMDMNS